MTMNNEKFLENIIEIRKLSPNTKYKYKYIINSYSSFFKTPMQKLIDMADKEEEEKIRWKNRTLRKQLIKYRNYLYDNFNKGTAKTHMTVIQTIYRTFEIEIQKLPSISDKFAIQTEPLSYNKMLNKKIIKEGVEISPPLMRAIILFMSSSGTGRKETLNLKIQDFIDATKEYHNSTNIYDVLKELKTQNDIVPTWRLRRFKTNKYYYTFSSPESTRAIIYHLINYNKKLTPTMRLFKTNYFYINQMFKKINDNLKLGKVGGYNRFRAHMLRKFHATSLYSENGLDMDRIDALQGRSKDNTRSAYFVDNPTSLKKEYISSMSNILIFDKINKLDDEATKAIKKENKLLSNRVSELEDSNKEFKELFGDPEKLKKMKELLEKY